MTVRYTFNLGTDRFDTYVMSLFSAPNASRLTRDSVISGVREGKFDYMLLRSIQGLEDLPVEVCDRAAINIIDFHFEALVLRNMGAAQLAGYCKEVEKTLRMESICPVDSGAPLWVSTVHHACVFSILAQFSIHLAKHRGCRKIIVIHQGDRPEPRLNLMSKAVEHESKVRPNFLQMKGPWLRTLSELSSPDCVIFYFGDMPHAVSRSNVQKSYRRGGIELFASSNRSIKMDTLFGGDTFARRLGAFHTVLEYPRPDRIRLRQYDVVNPVTVCPLEDWVFWPALTAVPDERAIN
jgi:hypothetical protein